MAAVEKYTESALTSQLRHDTREIINNSNSDIDQWLSIGNYNLCGHGTTAREIREYYNRRRKELWKLNRADVKTSASWIVTLPKDFPTAQQERFFQQTYNFLTNRYGEENTLSAIVHIDESGQPHMHYRFIPVAPCSKAGFNEKICANDVLNKRELRSFHSDLSNYLHEHGVDANVLNGATPRDAQGRAINKTVRELKQAREYEHEIATLKQKIHDYEHEIAYSRNFGDIERNF